MTDVYTNEWAGSSTARSSAAPRSFRYAKECSSNNERDRRATGTPNDTSSAASSNTDAVVDSYLHGVLPRTVWILTMVAARAAPAGARVAWV